MVAHTPQIHKETKVKKKKLNTKVLRTKVVEKTPNVETFSLHTHLHTGAHTINKRIFTNVWEPRMARSQRKPALVGQFPLPNMCFPVHHGGMGRIRITQT